MAWKEVSQITCDECGDFEQADTFEEARKMAAERDWLLTGSIDLCGRCRD